MVPFPQRVGIGPAMGNLTYCNTKWILSCKFDIEMFFETSWRYGKLSWIYFENFSWIRDCPPITTSQKWGFPKQSFTCMSQVFGMHVLALKYKEEELKYEFIFSSITEWSWSAYQLLTRWHHWPMCVNELASLGTWTTNLLVTCQTLYHLS